MSEGREAKGEVEEIERMLVTSGPQA